jgi:hypothetical protein
MRYHVKIDTRTGHMVTEPMKGTTDEELRQEFQQMIDDCPECRAAIARGELPAAIARGEQPIVEVDPKKAARFFKRPRWRDLRRR